MKKILSVAASIALAAALISCGDTSDFDGATDTVLTLEAPKVTAKAYPGVNYITWEPIAGAKEFELYRTTDGESSSTKITAVSGLKTEYADVAEANHVLADGKSYKYTVVAVSGSDPSRAVVVKSSQGSATVTAKVPTAGTNVKDFKDAKSYFDKFNEKNFANNVKVSEVGGRIYAEYPATAGFSYTLVTLDDKEYEARGTAVVTGTSYTNYKEDYKAECGTNNGTIKGFGKYSTFLKVESVSKLYEPTYITLESSREIKSIGEDDATTGASAAWIATNKVRISWTPATLKATGKDTATTSYKVYRSSDADNTWTDVTGTVVKGEKETVDTDGKVVPVYYTDNEVTDNTIGYKYYVVHTDGTYYGAYATDKNEATVSKYAKAKTLAPSVTADAYNNDTTGIADTIKIVAVKNTTDYNQTITVSYVKLAKDDKKTDITTYPADSFTVIANENENGQAVTNKAASSYTVYLKDASAGTYLIKVTASETGKDDSVPAYTLVTVGSAEASINDLAANFGKFTINGNQVKAVTIADAEINEKTNAISNYKYALYQVVITATEDYTDIVKVETKLVKDDVKLQKVTNASTDTLYNDYGLTVGEYANAVTVDYSTGSLVTNAFYVQKSLASDATVYSKKTVVGTYD